VIGIQSDDNPVARTASGMMMMYEDPLARIRHEAEMFLRAVDGNKGSDRFSPQVVVWLMVAFTQHLWKRQELMRKAYDIAMDRKMDVTVSLPALEPSEAQFIKDTVAEAIGRRTFILISLLTWRFESSVLPTNMLSGPPLSVLEQ
jgi:hypothetical protein